MSSESNKSICDVICRVAAAIVALCLENIYILDALRNITVAHKQMGNLEDVNIGIKASRLLEFLSGQEIDRAPQGDGITNLEELYRSMLKKVVLVAGESR